MMMPRLVKCEICSGYTPGVYEAQHLHCLSEIDSSIERLKQLNVELVNIHNLLTTLRAIVTLCENALPGNERVVLDNIRDVAEAAMKGQKR